jgi:DNA-directed RNA polymerase alpha subunit
MKPKLKTELVRVDYWTCGNPDHRHKTEVVAQACIDKREAAEKHTAGARRWTPEAYAEVLKAYRGGTRKSELARQLGLSKERARQVISKAERLEKAKDSIDPLETLSVRARNCLRAENIYTVDHLREALASGKLEKVPNLGAVSKAEIREWLAGLPLNTEAQRAAVGGPTGAQS